MADVKNKDTADSVGMVEVTVANRAPMIKPTVVSPAMLNLPAEISVATKNKGTIGHG